MSFPKHIVVIFTIYLFASCSGGPKEIEPVAQEPAQSPSMFEHDHNHDHDVASSGEDAWHTVVVKEILQAEKYSYLLVTHGENEMWIATLKANYNLGETYRMKTGLLKTNFKSIEHNRTFPELYLVSEIYPESNVTESHTSTDEIEELTTSTDVPNGVTSISDIVNYPEQFAGKQVSIYGKVVKANPNIMDRNWLHIDDGTATDYDFVITTQSQIPVGHEVGFEGTIVLDKDFGAGYTYAIIMEDAKPIR